jgi:hypothetical protein
LRVKGSGFRGWGALVKVKGLRLRVEGSGFRVWGLELGFAV